MRFMFPSYYRTINSMADDKENSKISTVTSVKCKTKTHLKDINYVLRSKQLEKKSTCEKVENTCKTRCCYMLRSHSPSKMAKIVGKTASGSSERELNVSAEKKKKVSTSCASGCRRSDRIYNLCAKQQKHPEEKKVRQMSHKPEDCENTLLSESTALIASNCDVSCDIGNDIISEFSNMSLSRDVEDSKNMDSHSVHSACSVNNEFLIQGVDGNIDTDSCFGHLNYYPDSSKRKTPGVIDPISKQVKKKKQEAKPLVQPELTENCLCIVKRKCGESHDECNINKKNKFEEDINNLQAEEEKLDKIEHIDAELSKKNVICSADLITVINTVMYNSHDRPNLKFYPDMFLKCACEPSACVDIHTNDDTTEMEESKAFVLKSLMKSKLWASAFNNFYTFLTTNNYLPTSLLRLLFGFIMTASDILLVNKAVEIITCHWDMHPPCRENLRKHYLNLLTESETADKDLPAEVSNDGLLYCILDMLESVMESPHQNKIKLTRAVDFQDLLVQPVTHKVKPVSYQEMSDQWQNFESFDNHGINNDYKKKIIHETRKEDEYLTQSQQIERLFMALELIIEVMERDMAVWLVKYSFTPFKYVRQNSCCPLIGKVLRTTSKQILKLYHLCGEHKHSRILARLITLLAEVARASEIQDIEGKGLIQYPYFSTECHLFVEDVYSSFVKSHRATDEKLELLELLQPAWVKMLVASQWLNDNLGHNYGHDLESTIKILQSDVVESVLFRSVSVEHSDETCAQVNDMYRSSAVSDNSTCKVTVEKEMSVSSQQRKEKKPRISDLSEETIHVLIIMTSSYTKTYCLQEIYNILKCKDLFESVIHTDSGLNRRGRVKLRFNYVQIVSDLHNYKELRKVLKSLCENTQFNVFHSWLSIFYVNNSLH